ncbi:Vacuolar protein sorting-associated protein 53 [Orbilia oligospora]|uniref:Vacuolar protein sorting-associated protein 53 n=1 Tax=Orbilia oligospora TaxID=2813651 RepID=A0A7C8P7S4_ORBOL|nr:Vacuolar protein sorting-associated protein 53 [Orbilia oligospora]
MNGVAPVDPLDSADYDPITHLNTIFSTPGTLSSVPSVSTSLTNHVTTLSDNIRTLVANQAISDASSVTRVAHAKADLDELFKNIETVRGRAIATEQAITAMTADIKRLDATKKNLTVSMTALKRLQMLTTAFEQLKAQCKLRQYRDCAQLLQAVLQLMAHFKSYRSIDQIATLSRNIAELQSLLLEQVCEDFELTFTKDEVSIRRNMLSEGCEVMDAVGDSARTRLVNWYCNTQLREYRQIFRGSEEAGSLDNISRRYSWLKRILKSYDEEHIYIFPAAWKVNEILARTFCDNTREDFKGTLVKTMRADGGKSLDVNLLLRCLQETLDFEQFLEKRFAADTRVSIDTISSREEKPLIFGKAISEAFEPYLSLWVDSQDKTLAGLIPVFKSQPIRPADEDFNTSAVLPSSIELFQFYKVTFAQCAKLSAGAKLYDLTGIFAKFLDSYSENVLLYHLPDKPGVMALPNDETIITILNTADYCHALTSQLEERIKGRIDEEYRNKVNLEKQQDTFMSVVSIAIRALTRKVEVELEPIWREMRNTPWSKLETVGDTSTYVGELVRVIKEEAKKVLVLIVKEQYKRAFCDRLVEGVANSILGNLMGCKPISEVGGEQMLLDVYSIKKCLEELMTLTAEEGATAPTTFIKHVTRAISRIDIILKVIQVRSSPPEGLVQAYLIHIADKSEPNFRKILDIKGIKGREVSERVELFHAHKSAYDGLSEGNVVMNLLTNNISSIIGGGGNTGMPMMITGGPGGLMISPALGGKFDAATFGSALMAGVKEGVDRLGTPGGIGSVGGSTGANSPGASNVQLGVADVAKDGVAGLNESMKNFGRFFRGGRFGSVDGGK